MTIEVTSMTAVAIDGTAAGCVVDAFANFPDQRAAIQDALMLFEQGLRQQIATLQTEKQTAIEAAEKATVDAAAAVQKAASDAADMVTQGQQAAAATIEQSRATMQASVDDKIATADAAVEQMRASAQSQVDELTATANATVTAAHADRDKAIAERDFANNLQQLHWQQVQYLMASKTESAVAVLKEIQKLELVDETARLEARRTALGA
jgi:hypothetical protein